MSGTKKEQNISDGYSREEVPCVICGIRDEESLFNTPESIVRLLVEMLEPYEGRVFDPCCGSGGMFVQSAHFIEHLHKSPQDVATFYGMEKNPTTIRLAKMNLAVHGLEEINALQVFTKDGIDPLLAQIKAEVENFEPDTSTAKGRAEIKSKAYKVILSKGVIDRAGADLVKGWKVKTHS